MHTLLSYLLCSDKWRTTASERTGRSERLLSEEEGYSVGFRGARCSRVFLLSRKTQQLTEELIVGYKQISTLLEPAFLPLAK